MLQFREGANLGPAMQYEPGSPYLITVPRRLRIDAGDTVILDRRLTESRIRLDDLRVL